MIMWLIDYIKTAVIRGGFMENKKVNITQYFSKWRNEWVDFKNQPVSEGEIIAMKKYYYELR